MLCSTPLDVLLLILRLLTLKDALSLFATCRQLHMSNCRPFWVYANIDMDSLPCTPGGPRIDYSSWNTDDLRTRVIRKWAIFQAWRETRVEPRRARVIPVNYDVRRVVVVPWTNLMVLMGDQHVFIHNWFSGASTTAPLKSYSEMHLMNIKLFWVESLNANVLIVHVSVRRGSTSFSELQFFAMDTSSLTFEAVISPFKMQFCPSPSVTAVATIRVMTPVSLTVPCTDVAEITMKDVLRATSFAILDETRFLVAGPRGLAIYKLPARAITSAGTTSYRVRALWRHPYPEEDTVSRPPLGPIRGIVGGINISVSSGNYLRSVTVIPGSGSKDQFTVTKHRLVERLPVYLGIASGYRVGVYRRPYSIPDFTTFSLEGRPAEAHPFFYADDHSAHGKGSVAYRAGPLETMEPGSLQVDEDQGRLIFMIRSHSKPSAKVVILELV
ncbi:hypothetical protein DFH09DRAFT_1315912 [Mycena vulgaris]|nr:hypothetical protein DFH09DRAFT_1315912 [Mycena vulgaris]